MDDDPLLALCTRWERARADGRPLSPEDLCRDRPDLLPAMLQRVASMSALFPPNADTSAVSPDSRGSQTVVGVDIPVDAHPPDASGTRYRPRRFHARGGLGEVYVADDLELNREVALKCLRRSAAAAEHVTRFVREAGVTGRLEHPGIVPVYGLTHGADGQPFYAMRFIRGETLQEAVKNYHALAAATESERRLALRSLLQRFTAVCNTIAYAHSQGIIHRDLKPPNVMLGEYGETLVVDWGLAKPAEQKGGGNGEQGGEGTSHPRIAAPLLPRSSAPNSEGDDGTPLTEAGIVIGTPAYMSPEQAAGEIDLGTPSDIFSLGAILYTILTGRPPYQGAKTYVMLEDARLARFPAPRAIRPDVSPPLEAICLKAMQRRPEARYASARDLAADVERWLADEPVTAWREPWTMRAGRWLRRHRTWVAAGAVLLVVSAGFFAALAVQANRAQEETARESRRAKANFDKAIEAIDKTLNHLGSDRLIHIPQFDQERRKIFADALELFNELLAGNDADPEARLRAGQAALRAGNIQLLLGDVAASKMASRRAIELLEQVVGERHNDALPAKSLARAYEQLARTIMDADDRRPVDDEEVIFRVQSDARRGHQRVSGDTGHYARPVRDEVDALCRRCIAVWEQIGGREPAGLECRFGLAEIYYRLAHLLVHSGQRAEGEAAFRQTRAHQSAMVRARPDDVESQALLGSIDLSAGAHFLRTGQWDDAEAAFQHGTTIYESVAPRDSQREKWQGELGYGRHALALMKQLAQRWPEAEAGYRSAAVVRAPLALDHRDIPAYQFDLARTQLNLGATLLSSGRPSEALPVFDEVLERLTPIVKTDAHDLTARQMTSYAHRGRAETLTAMGRLDEALAASEDALRLAAPADRDLIRIRRLITLVRKNGPRVPGDLPDLLHTAGANRARLNFEAACALAEASPALADHAVRMLEQCAALGYFRDAAPVRELLKAPELAELRKRPDVQKLIRSIEY